MKSLEIAELADARQTGVARLSAFVRWGSESRELFFRTAHSPTAVSGDPFVPAVLLPAMRAKLDLTIRSPVSAEILAAALRVQEVEWAWHPGWRIVKLDAVAKRADAQGASSALAVGAFFSGGVDSFYTLQKHRREITHLIFVSGFDVPLHRPAMRELILRELRGTADEIGLPLIEVETNLRELSNGLGFSWEHQHGAGLAAVAHFLAPGFEKIYVPSTYALPFLAPYGSHPGLDPLWGSPYLELVHDGIEATRLDKIGALSQWDTAVRNLRVCWALAEGQYNCCRCSKCLSTMALLRAHHALERARSFPVPLDLQRLSEAAPELTEQRYRFIQVITKLEQRGDDPALVDSLRKALNPGHSLRRSLRHSAQRLRSSSYSWLRKAVRTCRYLWRTFRGTRHAA